MATRSTEAVPVSGRVDRDGRLVAADAALERLQVEAGSALGRALALPQIAALARAAASLGVPLSRAVVAADNRHDLDLFIRAEPAPTDGDDGDILLTIERWIARPMAGPRLALVTSADDDEARTSEAPTLEFDVDAGLNLVNLSPALAARLGIEPGTAPGRPLTSLFRLIEEADGSMPLLAAVASRGSIEGQRAVPRDGGDEIIIDADPWFDAEGRFAGFHARLRGQAPDHRQPGGPVAFEESLDEALRSPLARIIDAADHIVERGDGPLRSDYATYASDIGAAARHLLSVIRAMGQSSDRGAEHIEVGVLAAEAVGLVDSRAAERGVVIALQPLAAPSHAKGEGRAVVQILVNILGNAVRHSPVGGKIGVTFERADGECRVTIVDDGPGIAATDQQRIFERYERVGTAPDGSGLGLAISRRLARSMGGDIRLESEPGRGARFTLILPSV